MTKDPEHDEYITQIIPAAGHEAIYKDAEIGEEFSHAIIAWGICVLTETYPSGKQMRYTAVKGFTLAPGMGILIAADGRQNFVEIREINATLDKSVDQQR